MAGLVGALLVARATRRRWIRPGFPVVPVHHLEGHLFRRCWAARCGAAVHRAAGERRAHHAARRARGGEYRLLGKHRDDAAGEAFDKTAKLLGLPIGRPPIEESRAPATAVRSASRGPWCAATRSPATTTTTTCLQRLKTAVLTAVRDCERKARSTNRVPAIASAFQSAVIDTLVKRSTRARAPLDRSRIVLGGGVACNRALRRPCAAASPPAAARVRTIARSGHRQCRHDRRAGLFRFAAGDRADPAMTAHASLPLPGILSHVS